MITSFSHNDKLHTIFTEYDDHIFKVIVKHKTFYEIKLLNKIRSFKLTGTVIDVGANIGNHTIHFSTQCKFSNVHSFEMNSILFDILQKNIDLNKCHNVTCHNLAVADENGLVGSSELNLCNTGSTHIVPDGNIKQIKLDDIDYQDRVSLIKIDVEGHELKVLNGAKNLILSNKPILVVECEDSFKEVNSLLSELGYITDHVNYASTPTYIWRPK